MNRRTAGFSLIEMLVVVAITSTLAIGATLAFARGSGTELGDARFAQEIARIQRRAMLSGVDHRITFVRTGWAVERRSAQTWQPLAGLQRTAQFRQLPAPVMLHKDGRISEGRIIFGDDDREVICETGGAEGVTCASR